MAVRDNGSTRDPHYTAMRKLVLIAIAILLAAAAGAAWYWLGGAGPAVQYRIGKVERGPHQAVVVGQRHAERR